MLENETIPRTLVQSVVRWVFPSQLAEMEQPTPNGQPEPTSRMKICGPIALVYMNPDSDSVPPQLDEDFHYWVPELQSWDDWLSESCSTCWGQQDVLENEPQWDQQGQPQ